MKIKDLFIVILKVMGILVLKDAIVTILAILPLSLSFFGNSTVGSFKDNFESFLVTILYFIGYLLVAYIFIFKAHWIIRQLKLTSDFSEQHIALNLSATTIISIALFVIGGWLIIDETPNFCRQLYFIIVGIKHKDFQFPFDKSAIIISIIKIIIGLLLIGEQRRIVAFLDRRATFKG